MSFEPGRYRRWKPHHDHGVRDHGRGEGRAGVASYKGGGPVFRGGGEKRGGGDKHGKHGKHGR